MRPALAAFRAVGERRRPACHCEGSQQVRIEDEARLMLPRDERAQARHEQGELLHRRLSLLRRHALGRLEHRRAGGPLGVIGRQHRTVRSDRLDLVHRVERASLVELHIDVAERLEPRTNTARSLADSARDTPHSAVAAGEEGDDAVGLAELLGTQDDGFVTVEAHTAFSYGSGRASTPHAHQEARKRYTHGPNHPHFPVSPRFRARRTNPLVVRSDSFISPGIWASWSAGAEAVLAYYSPCMFTLVSCLSPFEDSDSTIRGGSASDPGVR